jgi:hypothetical protein
MPFSIVGVTRTGDCGAGAGAPVCARTFASVGVVFGSRLSVICAGNVPGDLDPLASHASARRLSVSETTPGDTVFDASPATGATAMTGFGWTTGEAIGAAAAEP